METRSVPAHYPTAKTWLRALEAPDDGFRRVLNDTYARDEHVLSERRALLRAVVGRFLEHSRIYCFINGGDPECFIGSADWMRRNLDRRVETITPVTDAALRGELIQILDTYDRDNCSAWDAQPDGSYLRRQPADGESCRVVQRMLIEMADAAVRVDAAPAG